MKKANVISGQLVHNVALVLGGGGAAGNAWQIGIIAGLAEAGLDMTEAADLVIGTSSRPLRPLLRGAQRNNAGRTVGFDSVRARTTGQTKPGTAAVPAVGQVFRAYAALRRGRHVGSRPTTCDGRVRPGERLNTRTCVPRNNQRAKVAARFPHPEWPDRPMILVAVDAHTGQLAAFDRDSGADLVDVVTASTAMPGLTPTHNINGTRYINGGVRSAENADLASGYANVVVIGWRTEWTLPAGRFEGLRRFYRGADPQRARSRACASRAAASR